MTQWLREGMQMASGTTTVREQRAQKLVEAVLVWLKKHSLSEEDFDGGLWLIKEEEKADLYNRFLEILP